ncbi:MAG TPA: histidine kinase [Candidatus Polarisedimenticolaceae bacterium]|nr:histidine kinase [Candidatus Polarisedimenticolaceae bacterium]
MRDADLVVARTPYLHRAGDDPGWAAAEPADPTAWTTTRPRERGPWWFRTTLMLEREARVEDDLALRVLAPGAIEVFWDGERVGGSGRIGHDAVSERPGRHGLWVPLAPARVTAGEHVVAVRVSSWRLSFVHGPREVLLLDRGATERVETLRTGAFLFCAGLLVLAGVVFELLRRPTGARRDTELFATLTLLVALLLLLEYAKTLYPYPYTWHFPRLVAISTLTMCVGILLPVFASAHLTIWRPWFVAATMCALFVGLVVAFPDPDVHSLNMLRASIAGTALLALVGVVRGSDGATWILLAAAANVPPIVVSGMRYADHWFFVGFLAMVGVLLLRMAGTLRRRAGERDLALLRAERLRNELLRKTIQPHFLMNSLAVAIAQIEEEPARGVALLHDLASELEAFLAIGDRDLVPVREEIELCRKHVRTMAHLLDRPLLLEVEGRLGSLELPPGVLLTLVENAITHGNHGGDARITLRIADEADGLTIDVANASPPSAATAEGAGLRYVRSQLEHRPGEDWAIRCGHESGRWHTRLHRSR